MWANLVTWRSKNQRVVARSNAEAEYRTMSFEIREEIWLQKVLYDLYQDYEVPMRLLCDNKAVIALPITWSNMTEPNMWRLIDTLSKRDKIVVAFASLTYPRANKMLIYSQRGSLDKTLIHVLAS